MRSTDPLIVVTGYAAIDHIWDMELPFHSGRTTTLLGNPDPPPRFGGGAPTVALELTRLGRRVHLITWLGGDEPGRSYLQYLARAGVATDGVVVGADQVTPRAILLTDREGGLSCLFFPTGSHDLKLTDGGVRRLEEAAAVVLTVGPPALTLEVLQERPQTGLLVWSVKADPYAYPLELRRRLIAESDVISTNEDELSFLAECIGASTEGDDHRGLVTGLLRVAKGTIVVTSGARGAWLIDRGEVVRATPRRASHVDTVGAGDAFTAALVDRLLTRREPTSAIRGAVDYSSSFLQRRERSG